jgi:hypothetical protein
MTITERVAYLKGLMDGLELDGKEAKLLKAMMEVMDEMAEAMADMEDRIHELSDQVDEIDEDLSDVEDMVFDEEDDEACFGCDDEDDDDDDEDFDDDDFYEVTCDSCGETSYITGEIVDRGEMECPNCGDKIEFDDIVLEDECEGDCASCGGCSAE